LTMTPPLHHHHRRRRHRQVAASVRQCMTRNGSRSGHLALGRRSLAEQVGSSNPVS
jgi:hypothetical protein